MVGHFQILAAIIPNRFLRKLRKDLCCVVYIDLLIKANRNVI